MLRRNSLEGLFLLAAYGLLLTAFLRVWETMAIKTSNRIVLIDGNSLVYRAFFALPTTIALPSGQITNAVYGFTSMLIRLIIDERPDILAVAFDTAAPTHRHIKYDQYKAHREKTPDELISQFPLVKEVLSALAIPAIELAGFEADDLLATLARRSEASGDEVTVVTGDRDAFQLISERTRVMTTRKGITDIVFYDREKVIERYGVPPEKVPDYLGLKGDPSDNIPGVPGIGDKTAAKLLQEFGSIEGIYENLEQVRPDRIRESLATNEENARLSKQLATLHFDAPVDIDLYAYPLGHWEESEVRRVFSDLKFRSLLDRFLTKLTVGGEAAAELPLLALTIERPEPAAAVASLQTLAQAPFLGWEFTEIAATAEIEISVAAAAGDGFRSVAVRLNPAASRDAPVKAALSELAAGAANAVFDLKERLPLIEAAGLKAERFDFDAAIAAYLIEATAGDYSASFLAAKYLEAALPEPGDDGVPAARAAAAAALRIKLMPEIETEGLLGLLTDVEIPAARVLARMEAVGVGIDTGYLAEIAVELDGRLVGLVDEVYALAGEEFNLNSPQQLSAILFDKMGLAPGKKTKTKSAYATDISVLNKLIDAHPIIKLIISYRELTKLKSTYVDALPPLISTADGRLHTSFNQLVTATGRLSSSNPNLQNIPVRTELGRRIRHAFVPARRDEKLLVADYSQIELRLLAHLSGDPDLIRLFSEGVDFHLATAAEVFDVAPADVGTDMRRRAKAINFGIIYGISPFGLAEQLGIGSDEAKVYIDTYMLRFPAVKAYLEKCVSDAYDRGYAVTILGRRRYLPELKSTNYQVRSFGERVATNAPLQGSAADIIKLAMVAMDKRLIDEGWQTRMVLQVHDELVFEVPPLEEIAAAEVVRSVMEGAFELKVPLKVDISFGWNWGEAK